MKAMNELRKRKAISPVIATVILVAVAITVAVAVSYWMGSIASQYTKFEKVEIQSGYAEKWTDGGGLLGWRITLELKSSGTTPATLIRVFVNDVTILQDNYGKTVYVVGKITTDLIYTGTTIESGVSKTVYIYISGTYPNLTSGTTVNIKIHSAGGMDYIKLIELV